MTTHSPAPREGRTNLALVTLFLGTFVMGSAELLVVGVLNLIADDLQVSIPGAGTLVTAYALGLAVAGPILTALTIKLGKRTILVGSLVLYVLGNLVPVFGSSFALFIVARVFTGALQGLFVGVAFVAATSIVPPERMGRAISAVLAGFSVSAALGVPLGTLVGQALGWRGSFVAVAVLGVVALLATVTLVPPVPSTGAGAGNQAKYAFAPRVLAVLGLFVLVMTAQYSALTYIVPFLENVTGISGTLVSIFLLAYGVAIAAGTFGGGRFADKNAARTPIVATVGVVASLLALFVVGAWAFPVILALLAWGVFSFGMVPSVQYRVVSLAGPGGALAASLPASAANAGIALGSVAGGVAIGSFTASSAVLTGVIIAAIAVPAAWATSFLEPPVVEESAEAPVVAADPAPEPA
jgi:DHA1 family inner membrane transport protein